MRVYASHHGKVSILWSHIKRFESEWVWLRRQVIVPKWIRINKFCRHNLHETQLNSMPYSIENINNPMYYTFCWVVIQTEMCVCVYRRETFVFYCHKMGTKHFSFENEAYHVVQRFTLVKVISLNSSRDRRNTKFYQEL